MAISRRAPSVCDHITYASEAEFLDDLLKF